MESKNVKVIDEHGIDRNANIIFSIDVDGSDYAVYWIERDSENDNIFVSKLVKNLDNTSNMINIEDSMEKGKIVEVVKELIKYSIDNESDRLSTNSVVLPSGKTVSFSSVLINREQNINVQKTYITTVKKSVVKVTSEYYDVKVNDPVVIKNDSDILSIAGHSSQVVVPNEISTVQPVVSEEPKVVEQSTVVAEPVVKEVVPVVEPIVNPLPTPVVTEPVIPAVDPVVVAPVVEEVVSVVEPAVSPLPTPVVAEPVIPAVDPVAVAPVVEEVVPVVEPVVSPLPTPVVAESVQSVSVPESVVVPEEPKDNVLFFDASKETNLNVALGEVSNESKIPVEDVSPLREFGEEAPKVAPSVVATPEVVNVAEVPVTESNSKAGFANNKFFMFIAIAFFLASCVFLGYEVYNYFQLR